MLDRDVAKAEWKDLIYSINKVDHWKHLAEKANNPGNKSEYTPLSEDIKVLTDDQFILRLDVDKNGRIDSGDIKWENHRYFKNIDRILRMHGKSLSNIKGIPQKSEDSQVPVESSIKDLSESLIKTLSEPLKNNAERWGPKHRALVKPHRVEDDKKALSDTYIVERQKCGGYKIIGSVRDGEASAENHPANHLLNLYRAAGGRLDQKITVQIVDKFDLKTFKLAAKLDKQITLRELFEVDKKVLHMDDGEFPSFSSKAHDADALAFIQLGLKVIPVDDWDKKWKTVDRTGEEGEPPIKGKEVSFNDVVKAAEAYYLKQRDPTGKGGHGEVHMAKVLVDYYGALGDREGLERLKQKVIKDELSVLFKLVDNDRIAHYTESLGYLLSSDLIEWSDQEKMVVYNWANKLKEYIAGKANDKNFFADIETGHLYKGLELIAKHIEPAFARKTSA